MNISYRGALLFMSSIIFLFLISVAPLENCLSAEQQPALQSENPAENRSLVLKTAHSPLPPSTELFCGIAINDYKVKTGVVKPGQTLAHLLNPHGISKALVFQTAKKAEPVFDVRRIKAGNHYSLIYDPKDNDRIKYFIYHQNFKDYVVFAFKTPVHVYAGEKKVITKPETLSGTIATNLWNSARDAGMNQGLIYALGDIFGSSLDFRNLHKGDQFMITFEEEFVQNQYIGMGKIIAAQITCHEKTFHAFRYDVNGETGYYDEKGNSLEKSFLKCPLKYSRITSKFTPRRLHPITQKYIAHPGIDFAAPRGTPVRSVGDGTVIFKGYCKSAGNYIKISHNSFGISEYLHLSKFHAGIKKNQRVKKGQVIGYVGSTGYATGPHLDLRFKKNGKYVDYTKINLPSGKSLEKDHKASFLKQVALIKQQWNNDIQISLNHHEKEGYKTPGIPPLKKEKI